jgi:hypothetical protein
VHATWVRELVERVAPELRGPRSAHGIRVLNRELANLRAGITHDLAEAPEAALRTAGLLEWFWYRGGHVTDGLRLLAAALAGAPDGRPADRARALMAIGTLHFLTGEAEMAADYLLRGREAVATATDHEGLVLRSQGFYYESLLRSALGAGHPGPGREPASSGRTTSATCCPACRAAHWRSPGWAAPRTPLRRPQRSAGTRPAVPEPGGRRPDRRGRPRGGSGRRVADAGRLGADGRTGRAGDDRAARRLLGGMTRDDAG